MGRIIGGKTLKNSARRSVAQPSPSRSRAVPEGRVHAAAEPVVAVRMLVVDEESVGQRLDNFLLRVIKGVPKTHIYRIIRSGEVRVNKGRATADQRVAQGDVVRVPPMRQADRSQGEAASAPAREFPVLYEDDSLLVIDKPAGVAVHGGSGVSFGVIEQLRRARPEARFLELAHRLDRETSGLLVIAKKRSALTAIQDQFRHRETGKTYQALVAGQWPDSLKVIDVALHKYLTADGERRVRETGADDPLGKRSITLVKIARRLVGFTLLDVTIKTGRTHQIRVHLAQAGYPIVGDDKYGDFGLNKRVAREQHFERMFLHARQLRLVHPVTHEPLVIEADLPDACLAFLQQLQHE